MSILRLFASLSTLAVVLMVAAPSSAQQDFPTAPGAGEFNPDNPSLFDPDYQWFAPAITSEYGDEPYPGPTGWYFTYDRLYMSTTRPNDAFQPSNIDWGWGNRFDFGYMTDDYGGWLFSYIKVDGPNKAGEFDDIDDTNINPIFAPTLTGSFNFVSLTGGEINRVWRMKPFYNGSVLEPFLGFRFNDINDYYRAPDTGILGTFDVVDNQWTDISDINIVTSHTKNRIFSGQAGFRWFHNQGRWNLAAEARGFIGANFQNRRIDNYGLVADVFFEGVGSTDTVTTATGAEIRLEANYRFTRDVYFRVGWTHIQYFNGIGRGFDQNEDMFMSGVNFGFVLNR